MKLQLIKRTLFNRDCSELIYWIVQTPTRSINEWFQDEDAAKKYYSESIERIKSGKQIEPMEEMIKEEEA